MTPIKRSPWLAVPLLFLAVSSRAASAPVKQAPQKELIRSGAGYPQAVWIPGTASKVVLNLKGTLEVMDVDSGTRDKIADNVTAQDQSSEPPLSVSPDGGKVVYREDDVTVLMDIRTREKLDLADLAHKKEQNNLGTYEEWAPPMDVRWSPDGERIVYWDGVKGVSVTSGDGTDSALVHKNVAESYMHARWSPAGDQILFIRQARQDAGAYVSAPDGKNKRMVAAGADAAEWTKGGRLVYVKDKKLYLQGAAGADTLVGAFDGPSSDGSYGPRSFAVSPDGRKIAYQFNVFGPNPDAGGIEEQIDSEIHVYDVEKKSAVNVTGTAKAWESEPTWSPDGRRLLCLRSKKDYDPSPGLVLLDLAAAGPATAGK